MAWTPVRTFSSGEFYTKAMFNECLRTNDTRPESSTCAYCGSVRRDQDRSCPGCGAPHTRGYGMAG